MGLRHCREFAKSEYRIAPLTDFLRFEIWKAQLTEYTLQHVIMHLSFGSIRISYPLIPHFEFPSSPPSRTKQYEKTLLFFRGGKCP